MRKDTQQKLILPFLVNTTCLANTCRSSAAHCLTDFCKKALGNALPALHGQASKSVSGAYLFLCRQLYNNGEGLQAIYSYDLHSVLSKAWVEVRSLFLYNLWAGLSWVKPKPWKKVAQMNRISKPKVYNKATCAFVTV